MSFSRFALLTAAAFSLAACANKTSTDPTGTTSYIRDASNPARAPFISAGSVSIDTIAIGASGSYSVTVVNPDSTGFMLPLAATLVQGDAQRALTTHQFRCGALPSGTCTDRASFVVSNTAVGSGTIVPGPAAVRVELRDGTTVISHVDIPVTLISSGQ
jgi:hypothetical protein